MAELYFEGSLTEAFEAGRKAANGAIGGNLDVHVRDAAIKVIGEVHVLLSGHEDGAKMMTTAPPDCPCEETGELLRQAIEDAEAKCPKGAESATALALNPGQIAPLRLIAGYTWKILGDYFNK